ncbi:MAG: hypothetical protein HY827_09200 [Actinobacteria bacterium]|nr:hypothetical protein [Actinomycetota bacterium]
MNDSRRKPENARPAGTLTHEQALDRIAALESDLAGLRSSGQMLAEFFLRDILEVNMPLEVIEMIGRLMQKYMVERDYAPDGGDHFMSVRRNRFAIGPGDVAGKSDAEATAAAFAHFADEISPITVTGGDGRPYLALPLFTSLDTLDVFGVLAVELKSNESLPEDSAAVALSIALSVTLQLERTSRVSEAVRSTQYAQAAARAHISLSGPRERDDALRSVVDLLAGCDDVSGLAAITLTIDPPRIVALRGAIDEETALRVANAAVGVSDADRIEGLRVLQIRIEDTIESVLLVQTRSDLTPVEEEMLGAITRAVSGAVARYRAGLTIESLRRSATRRLVEAQERERSMVAADIHDGVLQQLGATAIRLELAQSRVEQGDFATARTIINDGADEIRSCARDLRRLLMELRPQVLDDNGLSAALHELGRQVDGVDVTVASHVPDDLGNEFSITIFRIVQEALTNIEKHAKAAHAGVNVKIENEEIDIEIRDDGVGYEAAVAGPSAEGSHLGLLGMRERARMLGGRFSIEGGPGRGTMIRAILPLTQGALQHEVVITPDPD